MYFTYYCDNQVIAYGKSPHKMNKQYYNSILRDLYFLCRVNKKTITATMQKGVIRYYVFIAHYCVYEDTIELYVRRCIDIKPKRVRIIKRACKPIIY